MKNTAFKLLLFYLVFTGCTTQIEKGVVIKNVNIIPIWKDTILLNHHIRIASGKIVSIDKNINTTVGDTIIEGNNGYLLPGLWDMHTHLPNKEKNGFGYKQYLALNFLSGVTNIRNMQGFDSISKVVNEIENKSILSPNIYFTPPPISKENHPPIDSIPLYIKKYKLEGYKYWKILSLPDKNYFDTLVKYTKNHLKLTGHISKSVGLKESISNGYSCIEHLQGYNNLVSDTLLLQDILKKTKQNDVYNCATLDWYYVTYLQYSLKDIYNREHLKYMPKKTIEDWKKNVSNYLDKLKTLSSDSLNKRNNSDSIYIANKLIILKLMFDKNCKLLISPDANGMFQTPGFSMLDEMKLYENAGIPKYNILRITTLNAAEWMGEKNRGSIQKNMNADLVLYDKNPLSDLNNLKTIKGIYFNKNWFDEKSISKNLKNLEQ